MKEFKKVNQTFIKSNNQVSKIFNRYLYCLIPFILLIFIYDLIWGTSKIAIQKNNLFYSIFYLFYYFLLF